MQPTLSNLSPEIRSTPAHALRAALRFLAVVRRRKLVLLAALVIAVLLGALFYKTRTPYYRATSSLLVQQTGGDPRFMFRGPSEVMMSTYMELFVSDAVLEGALKELNYFPPEINRAAAPELQAKMLRGLLSTGTTGSANIVTVSCRSRDPHACVAVIDALIHSALNFTDENQRHLAYELVSNLDKERRNLEERLFSRERELLQIRRGCGDIASRDNSKAIHPVIQRAMNLNEALLEKQQLRTQLEVSAAAIRRTVVERGDLTQHLKALEPLVGKDLINNALGVNPEQAQELASTKRQLLDERERLARLLQHYDVAHPKVVPVMEKIHALEQYLGDGQARLDVMRNGIWDDRLGERLQNLVADAAANAAQHEAALQQQYGEASAAAVALNDRLAEAAVAERDTAMLRNLHDALLNRIANIEVNVDQSQVRIAVLSEPLVPTAPVFPILSQIMLRSLFGGTLVGLLAVYALDLLDDRFRSPEELKEQLGLPVLALVGRLPANQDSGVAAIQLQAAPHAAESEAFRTLRTTLAFGGQGRERLAITSAGPGDGKTTVLANLATAFAQAGKKTLLVDADMRRPGLSKLLDMRRAGGLSEVLRSRAAMDSVCREHIQPSGIEHLDVLPCGPKPTDPVELLSGPRLAELIGWAEMHYDQVLIDCPPTLVASDAAIVGRHTDGTMLVVRPDTNHRRAVIRAVEGLTSLGVNMLGVVVNGVGTDKDHGYYGYGTSYEYGEWNKYHTDSFYGQEEDEDDAVETAESSGRAPVVRRRAASSRAA